MLHEVIISIGTNYDEGRHQQRIADMLMACFSCVALTPVLRNPAIGMPEATPDFHNQLALVHTTQSQLEVNAILKALESLAGNTRELRKKGIIVADIDIITYDNIVIKEEDTKRNYYTQLIKLLK